VGYAFVSLRGGCSVADGTYDCHGVGFSYPSSWSAVDDSNVKQFKKELSGASDLIVAVVSAEVTHRPTRVEVGGLQSFRVQVEGAIRDQAVTFTGFALVRGTTEYFLACVSTPDHARDIRQGCQQVMKTFHVS